MGVEARRPEGVLLDFAGTLFDHEALADTLAAIGVSPTEIDELAPQRARLRHLIDTPQIMPVNIARLWHARDLSVDQHASAFVSLLIYAGMFGDLAHRVYQRAHAADAWFPYPDARHALELIRAAGVPICIVSNVGWDIRAAFAAHRLLGLVDEFVLSCELGKQKPSGEIFSHACNLIGVDPHRTLMVGDSQATDRGASVIGCKVRILTDRGPTGLHDSLMDYFANSAT